MGEEITEEGGEWHVACVRCVFQNWADTTSGQFAEGSFGKDSDAGRDWGQEEKGSTEDEMAGWHHWLDGRESEWTPGVGDGQGGLMCCDSWGCKESDTTEQLNWTELEFLPLSFTFKCKYSCNSDKMIILIYLIYYNFLGSQWFFFLLFFFYMLWHMEPEEFKFAFTVVGKRSSL